MSFCNAQILDSEESAMSALRHMMRPFRLNRGGRGETLAGVIFAVYKCGEQYATVTKLCLLYLII